MRTKTRERLCPTYLEWACSSGLQPGLVQQSIDVIDGLVATYPERLLLTYMLQHRNAMGFGEERRCDFERLDRERELYQQALARILQLL
jgi:hypothetical protein